MEGVPNFSLGTEQHVPSLDVASPELELSNTEKRMLMGLAQEGGPLWKVLRYFHDYGAGLRQAMANADLEDADQLKQAKKVQAKLQGAAWVLDEFQSALTLNPEEEKKDD